MADQQHGFGGFQSPPDARDLVVGPHALAAAAAVTLPDYYLLPQGPPIRDQGLTPQCVAYSTAYEQAKNDRPDFGRWIDFNEGAFFVSIGGNASGAVMRNALDRLLHFGYPEHDSTPSPQKHMIAGYARVEQNRTAVKTAVKNNLGVLVVSPWWDSWSHPLGSNAVLPPPSGDMNGHAWWIVGWDAYDHFICQNSWGTLWGDNGLFRIDAYYLLNYAWEIWTTADVNTMSKIARVRITELNTQIRTRRVLDPDYKLTSGSVWGYTREQGIRRESDGKLVATPWNRAFKFKQHHSNGALHGIGKYPRGWTELVIGGWSRFVPRPYAHLVSA